MTGLRAGQTVAALIVLAAAALGLSADQAQARGWANQPTGSELVLYAVPMLTEVIDPFRPPAHIGAPGNRGLEYGNSDNQVVAAAASGYISHAGQVAGRKTITIEHDDGVRTTYTGLLEIWATEGTLVQQGTGIALASSGFHFGARVLDHYLDPQVLIDSSTADPSPRLVPPD